MAGWLCVLGVFSGGVRAETPVKFDEVFSLVRSNLTGVSEAELSKAATLGFIEKLQGKVELSDAPAEPTGGPLVAKTNVFDGVFGYVRLNRIGPGVGSQALEAIKSSKNLKGLVLDLRFARGNDYAAAVELVGVFLGTEKPVLQWGEHVAKTAARSEVVELPLAVLVNRQTTGAAEALAGALREQQLALLIGSRTAGQAVIFDDFPLSNGQHLKIAHQQVMLAGGQAINPSGLAPDITVDVDEKNERRWLDDPYLAFLKPGVPAGPAPFLTSLTNRLNRRPNGAEVARRHREALDEENPEAPKASEVAPLVVQDAALSRALDFLKGLTVPRLRESGAR